MAWPACWRFAGAVPSVTSTVAALAVALHLDPHPLAGRALGDRLGQVLGRADRARRRRPRSRRRPAAVRRARAGPPLVTASTAAPPSPADVDTPIQARSIACPRARRGITSRTVFEGTAKPTPTLPPRAGGRDLRVHADHPAAGVHQRPAGVAGVDRGVGLDHLVDLEAVGRLDLAPEAGDDPRGGGAVEAERVAHGHDRVANPDLSESRERQRRRVRRRRSGSMRSTARSRGGVAARARARDAVAVLAEAHGGAVGGAHHVRVGDDRARCGPPRSPCPSPPPACTDDHAALNRRVDVAGLVRGVAPRRSGGQPHGAAESWAPSSPPRLASPTPAATSTAPTSVPATAARMRPDRRRRPGAAGACGAARWPARPACRAAAARPSPRSSGCASPPVQSRSARRSFTAASRSRRIACPGSAKEQHQPAGGEAGRDLALLRLRAHREPEPLVHGRRAPRHLDAVKARPPEVRAIWRMVSGSGGTDSGPPGVSIVPSGVPSATV